MKKETLKDWCKEWTIEEIANNLFSDGMMYMSAEGNDVRSKRFQDNKKILIRELKRRCK